MEMKTLFFLGATAWEGQIGLYWFSLSYPKYWLVTPPRDWFRCGKELL
jgi:hypothetical protein